MLTMAGGAIVFRRDSFGAPDATPAR